MNNTKEVIPNIERKIGKEKKKNSKKAALKEFDPRGLQTLFRTVSRNHYNLLKMVDNKASIILTVNSIIISLLMGAIFITPENHKETVGVITKVMINFSMCSMVFALLSMLPHKYLVNNNSDYKGTLYAGNFAKTTLAEFQEEFKRITKNGKNVYD